MKTIWVTRALPFARLSSSKLRALGYNAIAAPLLYRAAPDKEPNLPPDDATLIFTSRNGVSVYCQLSDFRYNPVIAVGDATARQARSKGFRDVISVAGRADDIVDLIIGMANKTMTYCHISGKDPRGDIIERLQASGFNNAYREIFYEMKEAERNPCPKMDSLDYVLVYSPKAAGVLARLNPNLSDSHIISISAATDKELGKLKAASRKIAAHPNEQAIFALLQPSDYL